MHLGLSCALILGLSPSIGDAVCSEPSPCLQEKQAPMTSSKWASQSVFASCTLSEIGPLVLLNPASEIPCRTVQTPRRNRTVRWCLIKVVSMQSCILEGQL